MTLVNIILNFVLLRRQVDWGVIVFITVTLMESVYIGVLHVFICVFVYFL